MLISFMVVNSDRRLAVDLGLLDQVGDIGSRQDSMIDSACGRWQQVHNGFEQGALAGSVQSPTSGRYWLLRIFASSVMNWFYTVAVYPV